MSLLLLGNGNLNLNKFDILILKCFKLLTSKNLAGPGECTIYICSIVLLTGCYIFLLLQRICLPHHATFPYKSLCCVYVASFCVLPEERQDLFVIYLYIPTPGIGSARFATE